MTRCLHGTPVELPAARCIVCYHGLTADDTQTCETCIAATRTRMDDIADMWAELPDHLERHPEGDMPGGDAQVLLAAGSEGLSEDEQTVRGNDPGSVAFDLGWWAMDWSEERGDDLNFGPPPRDGRQRPPDTVVVVALDYLLAHGRWAAQHHLGYDAYAADIRKLHARMETVTARHRAPTRAGVPCFDCGGDLVHEVDEDNGLEDCEWTCQLCRRRYTDRAYALALSMHVQDASMVTIDGEQWATVARLAHDLGRSLRTVQAWHTRGIVRTVRRRGVLLLHVGETRARHLPWWLPVGVGPMTPADHAAAEVVLRARLAQRATRRAWQEVA